MRPIRLDALLFSMLLVVGLLSISPPAAADPGKGDLWRQRHRLDLGLYAGVFFPPRAHELYDQVAWQEPFDVAAFDVGLRVGYMPWPFIGLELEGGVMPTSTREGGDSALLYTARAHVIGQYPAMFTPFLLAGYGILGVASSEAAVGDDVDGAFHAGLGVKYHPIKRLTVRLDGRLIVSGSAGPTGFMPHFEVLAGISYMLFVTEVVDEKADGDGDGVPDHKDKCPKLAARTPDGCPPPDRDHDGIIDSKDACPDKAARTADGCPIKDSDGDGVPDEKDKCPDKPETQNGHEDDDGCPDKAPPAVKPFAGTFPNVRFRVNSARLRKGRNARILGKVARALKKHARLRIKLRGHADERGPDDYNLELSRKRAEAVKRYLLRRGVNAGQLEVEAVGEAEPLGGSMGKNRRVEFKIVSK